MKSPQEEADAYADRFFDIIPGGEHHREGMYLRMGMGQWYAINRAHLAGYQAAEAAAREREKVLVERIKEIETAVNEYLEDCDAAPLTGGGCLRTLAKIFKRKT